MEDIYYIIKKKMTTVTKLWSYQKKVKEIRIRISKRWVNSFTHSKVLTKIINQRTKIKVKDYLIKD